MLRVTVEAMAAALGGVQSLHTEPFDTAARPATEFSRRIARNVQIILREEAYLTSTADPAAGSYYLEHLTHSIAESAWKLFREFEEQGGFISVLRSGVLQDTIEAAAERKRAAVSRRKEKLVGTNQYPNVSEQLLPREENGNERGRPSAKPVQGDDREVARRLTETDGRTHTCEHLATAFAEGARILHAEKALDPGEPEPERVRPLRPFRAAERFERLRERVEGCTPRPAVFLATFGPAFWRRARATFASGFYGAAGFDIIDNPGFSDMEAAAVAAHASGAVIIVACSDDESYPVEVPVLTEALRRLGSTALVVVAGRPGEQEQQLLDAGVRSFIHVGSDLGAELEATATALNIDISEEGGQNA
jgi:methylmalonyl-CoA mutase